MARAALNESEAAVAQARALKTRVDTYARQVHETRSDLDASSKQLASAQDAILDQTITANLRVVRAPASGVVEHVAVVAQAVREGDVVVAIGQRDRLRVVLSDTSGAWRALKEDARIPVAVGPAGAEKMVQARIDEIDRAGAGARIEVVLDNPRVGGARAWRPGTEVRAMVPAAATAAAAGTGAGSAEITVPAEAVIDLDGADTPANGGRVAVLVPQPSNTADSDGRPVRIEWRQVARLAADGTTVRVRGLAPGETILLRPALLPERASVLQLVG